MRTHFRFVIISKVAHPWFDEVHRGALIQAELLRKEAGIEVAVDYLAPKVADSSEQASVLERAAEGRPDGIAIDPVDSVSKMPAIYRTRDRGIPILLFDSPSPEAGITSVGNDFTQQGVMAAERLVELIGGSGKVAIMQGFPTAPNHRERYEAQTRVLRRHPGISIVDGGTDNDEIQRAEQQATAVLASHPDLRGYLCCDAAGPIGIAAAIKKAGRIEKVRVVGMDAIKPILEAIKEGLIDSSSATIPRMQGSMTVLMLWQASVGGPIPRRVDTGIDLITRENVDSFLAAT